MSEQPSWVPSDEEIELLLSGHETPEQAIVEIRDTILEAVERALAEQSRQHLATLDLSLEAYRKQEARHKRVRSVLDSLKKHCELTSPATVTHSTTYQLVISAIAALDAEVKP